jgi:hypothetical protein
MKIIYLSIISLFLITGCSSTFKHSEIIPLTEKLDTSKGVLISIPKDGWHKNIKYDKSGEMTAKAIKDAFSQYVSKVDLVAECSNDQCLNTIDVTEYGYFVKPEIVHWEDRATGITGLSDKIEIKIGIYDTKTSIKLASATYLIRSNLLTFGGDKPQDLLMEPTSLYVDRIYR